jgi:hypothetical protein
MSQKTALAGLVQVPEASNSCTSMVEIDDAKAAMACDVRSGVIRTVLLVPASASA